MKFAWTLAAAAVAIGCSGGSGGGYVPKAPVALTPASVQKGQEASLFPFKVGNSWTYATQTLQRANNQTAQKSVEVTFKVVKVEDVSGGKRATIDLFVDGKTVDRQVWLSTPKGIYQSSIGLKKVRQFSSPIPAIVFPVEPDTKFSWSGSDGANKMSYQSKITGPQEVDTEEKRMAAIAVDSTGTSSNSKITEKLERTIWFVPGVGIVRIRESAVSNVGASELLISLKSHNVK